MTLKKYSRDKVSGKWVDSTGVFLSCGNHVCMKYHGEVVCGTIEYDEMWNGGYYLVLDNGEGSLPMFGPEIEVGFM